jgi:hypothetical protein
VSDARDARPERPRRLFALGASNLTRGLREVVSVADALWGPDLEIVAALGHGRSYGLPSRVFVRGLPGILGSGLWDRIERAAPAPGKALVSDVGNDILYGAEAERVLDWVEECVVRLQRSGARVVITGLPLAGIRGLSPAAFLFFRSLFAPACRLSRAVVQERAERVETGLEALARRKDAIFFPLNPAWYGIDPIHIRPGQWASAFREMLLAGEDDRAAAAPPARVGWLRLYAALPDRVSFFGVPLRCRQPALETARRSALWLY